MPCLHKDAIKESLWESLGPTDIESSRRLGYAAIQLLNVLAGELLSAGSSVVVEANFRAGLSEGLLLPLVAKSRAFLIHCHVPAPLALQRYRDRVGSADRHPAHHDLEVLETLAAVLPEYVEPLRLPIPVLAVDTSDGYRPSLAEIVAFAHNAPALQASNPSRP